MKLIVRNMRFKHLFLIITALLTLPFTAFSQEEQTVFKHGSGVRTVAYSPVNPALVASAGDDSEIKLWDLQRGTAITLGSHADTVNAIAFSPDGNFLISGGDDYVIKLWDVRQKRHLVTREHITDRTRAQVKAVAFSPNGEMIATGGRHAKLWNAQTRNEIATFRHDEWVWTVAFSSDGNQLATGDDNGHVNVWNLQSQRSVVKLHVDSNAVYTVGFSPNNQILAGGGYDGKIKLWKVPSWQPHGTLTANGTISEISFSPDSRTLAATGYKSVYLWEVGIGENIATLTGHTDWVRATTFSPDGSAIMSSGADGTVRIWNVIPYSTADQNMVKIIYFVPRDRRTQTGIWSKLATLIRDVQRFYADQMQTNRFSRKTFTFETDKNGKMLIHHIDGQFTDRHYHTDTGNKIYAEIASQFDLGRHTYLIVADISSELIGEKDKCGIGGGNWYENGNLIRTRGGYAVIPASGNCFNGAYGRTVTAHELGHAFGLEHDFRDDTYVMSYGQTPHRLSKCATRWLDANRFFNTDQTAFDEPATIQMLTPSTYLPNARNHTLQFEVRDTDGIHQVQLLVPTTAADPASGSKLHSCKDLNTQNSTLEFSTPSLTKYQVNDVVLQMIDVYGNITRQHYTLKADTSLLSGSNADINGDGSVDVTDLVLVASNFGKKISGRVRQNPDVNRDGVVNVVDLLLVASLLRSAPTAPALQSQETHIFRASDLQEWIRQAKNYDLQIDSDGFRPSTIKKGIAVLEQLLSSLDVPTETRLLTNYPNPFNPETWIPYQLSELAEVTLRIYTMNGALVRTLELGHQPAGMYQTRNRAIYWNGQNELGEDVASGIYFYTLSAGDFKATRKMLIRK